MRLFDEHIKRKTILLDGVWDFATDEGNVGINEEWFKKFPKDAIKVTVPGCINNRFGYINFQNTCWYKKEFYTQGSICIKFNSVSEYARVYLDGEYLGDHYGGFTAFEFEAKVDAGIHSLVVMVDPRCTEDTIPLLGVDWHHYCGIMRNVELFEFDTTAIKYMRVGYELSEDMKKAKYNIRAKIKSFAESAIKTNCRIDIDGDVVCDEVIEVDGEKEICISGELNDIRLWDIYKPELYTVTIKTDDDDLIDKIGFRKIEVEGKRILLNKKPVKFLGVNRHEEHPDWGFAMPPALNMKDIDIIKDLNANTIRGAHYPNTKLFVDLCDANGIMFWSEIPMWGFKKDTLSRPLVIERGITMHTEMVEQYYNHPSIVVWGMHNEIASDTQEGYDITEKFVKCVRELEPSRLITFASALPHKDICFDLCDFISINQYIGWYWSDHSGWERFFKAIREYLKEKGLDNKPMVMSEFGVAALFGNKNFEGLKWSENYQVEYFDFTLNMFLNDEEMSGVYLWQYCDTRTYPNWDINRARAYNNKGILNEYRQPKLAYYKVKEIFEKESQSTK